MVGEYWRGCEGTGWFTKKALNIWYRLIEMMVEEKPQSHIALKDLLHLTMEILIRK